MKRLFLLFITLLAITGLHAESKFYFDEYQIKPGEKKSIELKLKNELVCEGFQLKVTLPDGLSFYEDEDEEDVYAKGPRIPSKKFTLDSELRPDGSLNFNGYTGGNTIGIGDGVVMTLFVEASANAPVGVANIKISGAEINMVDSEDEPQDVTIEEALFPINIYQEYNVTVATADSEMGSVAGSGTYTSGSEATVTATATEGYKFVKWNDGTNDVSTDNPYTFTVSAETTLTAVFAPENYTATFVLANGETDITITQAYKSALTAPVAGTDFTLVEGHTFAGWNPEVPKTMPLNGGTYTAQWTANEYTMTFKPGYQGGGKAIDIKQAFGTSFMAPTFTRVGYDFAGWSPEVPATIPAGDMEFTAQWTPITYTIQYDLNGGQVEGDGNPTTYTIESETFTLTNPTKDYYTFAGWTGIELTEASTTVTIATGSNGDREYTATWTPVEYTITYNLDGGAWKDGQTVAEKYTVESDDITLGTPEKTGFTFTGWTWAGQTEPQTTAAIATGSNGDKVFTANWSRNSYTLTLVINGTESEGGTFEYEATVTKPEDPEALGYTFTGWDPAIPETMPAENVTCTAQFVPFVAVDWTAKVTDNWLSDQGNVGGPVTLEGIAQKEQYQENTTNVTGNVLYQTVEGLKNGTYTVELYANASYTSGRGFASEALNGDLGRVIVFAGDVEKTIPVFHQGWVDKNNIVVLENVVVSDGKLTMGMKKLCGGSNWHTIAIKTLTQTNNDQKADADAQNAYWTDIAQQINGNEGYAAMPATAAVRTALTSAEDAAAVKAAIPPFYSEAPAFVAFANAKAFEFNADPYKYASADKKTAYETACAAAPTTGAEAAEATTTLVNTRRALVESHALAEGVEGAEDKTSLIINPNSNDNSNGWETTLGEGSGGNIGILSNEPWTDASGNSEHNYFDGGNWGANAWDVTFSQNVTIPQGDYMLTAIARGATELSSYRLFAGEASVEMPHISSVGGVFNRGWNDNSVEFTVDGQQTVTIGVQGVTETEHNWMSFSNFRLVRLGDNAAFKSAYDALSQAITAAEALNADDYTEDSQTALTDAIAAANTALAAEEATSTTLANAKTALETALDQLVTKAQAAFDAAKADLDAAIKAAEALTADDYTEASQTTLTNAIAAAKTALTAEDATTESLTTAKTTLEDALATLVTKAAAELAAAKEALQQEITKAEETYDKVKDSTDSDIMTAANNLKAAIDAAKAALENSEITVAGLADVQKDLEDAESALNVATTIRNIYAKYGQNVQVYTIDGKKVNLENGSLRKGMYIINGKKVVIK